MKHGKSVKIAACLLAVLLLFGMYSCAEKPAGEQPETTTDEATDAATEADQSVIVICDGSDNDYIVVRSDHSGSKETAAAVLVKKAIKDLCPDTFDDIIKTDFDMKNKADNTIDVEGKEILIGNTNRRQSRDIYETLGDDDYVITVKDDKIVIVGGSEFATQDACNVFINDVLTAPDNGVLKIERDLMITGKSERKGPPLEQGSIMRYMTWNLGCAVGVVADALVAIESFMPDILATQESNAEIYNNVLNVFLQNHGSYKNAVQYHADRTLNYTPIIYNFKVLTLVEAKVEWLRDRYTLTNTKSVCYAVFDYKDGGRFAVINFHGAVCSNTYKGYENMTSDERSAIADQWRTGNVKQVLEIRDSIVSKYGDIPITINGDCNFSRASAQYATVISSGFVDCEETAAKKLNAGYKTSYKYADGIPGPGNSIDHIFGTPGVYFALYDTVRDEYVRRGSDHTPVYTDFNPFGKGE